MSKASKANGSLAPTYRKAFASYLIEGVDKLINKKVLLKKAVIFNPLKIGQKDRKGLIKQQGFLEKNLKKVVTKRIILTPGDSQRLSCYLAGLFEGDGQI